MNKKGKVGRLAIDCLFLGVELGPPVLKFFVLSLLRP